MTATEMSDEADALYQPLGGLEAWAAVAVDEAVWAGAVERVHALRRTDPAWGEMVVGHGALLACAHQTGALDGLYAADPGTALALLRGEVSVASLDGDQQAHVRANHEALRLARGAPVSEHSLRRLHEVACRTQLTHRVLVGGRVQDHVLASGEYKHHPNHVPLPVGGWRATAPVAAVPAEVARLVETVTSGPFAALHPVTRAAWLHHAVDHVRPFADGNGRLARALASGCLLRAVGVPFLVFAADVAAYEAAREPPAAVDLVLRTVSALVELLARSHERDHEPALRRWRAQDAVASELRAALRPAVERALDRYRRRPETSRWADLSAAEVVGEDRVVVRVRLADGGVVEEALTVVAHPLDGGPVVAVAAEAGTSTEAGTAVDNWLDRWLDRVVSCLALRVAADVEP